MPCVFPTKQPTYSTLQRRTWVPGLRQEVRFTSNTGVEAFLNDILKTNNQTLNQTSSTIKTGCKYIYYRCKYQWQGLKTCPCYITIKLKAYNNIEVEYCLTHTHNPDYNQIALHPLIKNLLRYYIE